MVAPLVLIAARRFGKKCVVLVHGLDLVYSHPLYRWLCVRWLAKCDRVIANSRYTARLAEEKKVDRAAISVIHPGVNPAPAPCAGDPKEKLGLAGRKILLYVGRLAKRKGVAEFIRESLPAIAAAIPEACLLVAGENPKGALLHRDDIAGEIQKAAEETGLQSQVRLLGWVADEQLGEIYRAADLLIMPGLRTEDDVEGFGIVLIEAAAAGKPCVATRVGGIPDAVEDGKSGVLVEPGDYDGMSRAIVDLLGDDRKRSAMGEYARARVEENFNWKIIARKYEEVLNL
jgi:phosphatidylinositol alpha-1,6-mannosyltransferase